VDPSGSPGKIKREVDSSWAKIGNGNRGKASKKRGARFLHRPEDLGSNKKDKREKQTGVPICKGKQCEDWGGGGVGLTFIFWRPLPH